MHYFKIAILENNNNWFVSWHKSGKDKAIKWENLVKCWIWCQILTVETILLRISFFPKFIQMISSNLWLSLREKEVNKHWTYCKLRYWKTYRIVSFIKFFTYHSNGKFVHTFIDTTCLKTILPFRKMYFNCENTTLNAYQPCRLFLYFCRNMIYTFFFSFSMEKINKSKMNKKQ